MTIVIKGKSHPVSDKFRTEVLNVHPDLATRNYGELTVERDRLLHLSNQRYNLDEPIPAGEPMAQNNTLTVAEQARLENITHVINVHNAVKFLNGRSHADFGFDGVDQVHGNRWTLACGCVKHVVFDHHKRHDAARLVHHDHPHPHDRKCDIHK
jgi:hypothetical protein